MSQFIGDLDIRLVKDTDKILWQLLSPFSYQSDKLKLTITAPEGFITDLMSVPRLPLIYAILGNRGHELGVIHDFIYQFKLFPRRTCDDLILEMGPLCGFSWHEIWQIYVAVRMCGQSYYGRIR